MNDLALGFIFSEERGFDAYFGLSLVRVARELDVGKWIALPSTSLSIGRNQVVRDFLETDKDYLLFVDTDMTFSPQMIADLYEKRNPEWVLSGLCQSRDGVFIPRVRRGERFAIIEPPAPDSPDQLREVDGVGAAFTLVHRDIYEKVGANYSHTSRPWYAESERFPNMTEDTEFCARAQECGFKVVVDCTIRPGHRKVRTIGGQTIPA